MTRVNGRSDNNVRRFASSINLVLCQPALCCRRRLIIKVKGIVLRYKGWLVANYTDRIQMGRMRLRGKWTRAWQIVHVRRNNNNRACVLIGKSEACPRSVQLRTVSTSIKLIFCTNWSAVSCVIQLGSKQVWYNERTTQVVSKIKIINRKLLTNWVVRDRIDTPLKSLFH